MNKYYEQIVLQNILIILSTIHRLKVLTQSKYFNDEKINAHPLTKLALVHPVSMGVSGYFK